MAGIKNDLKRLFHIFKENLYYIENVVNGPYLDSKLTLLKFSQNLCIIFF